MGRLLAGQGLTKFNKKLNNTFQHGNAVRNALPTPISPYHRRASRLRLLGSGRCGDATVATDQDSDFGAGRGPRRLGFCICREARV